MPPGRPGGVCGTGRAGRPVPSAHRQGPEKQSLRPYRRTAGAFSPPAGARLSCLSQVRRLRLLAHAIRRRAVRQAPAGAGCLRAAGWPECSGAGNRGGRKLPLPEQGHVPLRHRRGETGGRLLPAAQPSGDPPEKLCHPIPPGRSAERGGAPVGGTLRRSHLRGRNRPGPSAPYLCAHRKAGRFAHIGGHLLEGAPSRKSSSPFAGKAAPLWWASC